jgi:plasmid stabilization system protein ParE
VKIRILDEAEADLRDGASFYQMQGDGLGDYFLDSIFSDIDSLRLHAGVHERHHGCHRMLAHRFPYAIYYRVHGECIDVHAVLDCRRNPARTRERLD